MRTRRIIASIIDIIILLIVFASMLSFWPLTKESREKYNRISKIESSVKNYNDFTSEQKNEIMKLSYEIDHDIVRYYLVFSLILIVYFVLIPKFRKDQTFGQKIMKIRLVSDDNVTINTYVIRLLLNSGVTLLLIYSLSLYIFNVVWYSRVTSLVAMIQIIYWIISLVMLLVTKETIHDKLTKTRIIEVKR